MSKNINGEVFKTGIFFQNELSFSIEKECLSLRYGFGIPSDKSKRTFRMNQSDR